jgi:cytochrome c-type protein NapB
LRGAVPLTAESTPPQFPKNVNDDQRKTRNYPMQPPLIPHQIDNYQVDLRFNKCMDCHGRARTQESGAPMVSVTHFRTVTATCWARSRRGATSAPAATWRRPTRACR